MQHASNIMLPNGQPAGGGGVPVTLIHDPGASEAITNGLARLHDVQLFTEATRRFRADEHDTYDGEFGNAAREVLDDLNAFHHEVAAWGQEKQAAMQAAAEAAAAEQEAAERAAALDAQGNVDTDDDAAVAESMAAEAEASA